MKRLLLLIFISTSAFSSSEVVYKQSLLNKYFESIEIVKKQEKACKVSAIILPKDTFKRVKISEEELSVVLNYFYFKSEVSCSKDALHDYYAASVLLRLSDKKTEKTISTSDELISLTYKQFIKAEMNFSRLPIELKKQVEKIELLNKPFLPLESLENISS